MLYTLFIVAHMHGQLAVATHDFKTMQTCLAVKKEMVTLLKDYDARIVCEPKLGEI